MFRKLGILIAFCCFLTACGVKKQATSGYNAAAAANAMAKLESKSLYKFITEWSGVKYRLGGLQKSGIDCSGFAMLLQQNIYGVDLPRRSRDQAEKIKQKKTDQLKEGDLIFFSFGGREIDHVGIYLNDNFFVHASTNRGVVVDDLRISAYQKALVKSGSVKL